MSWFESYLQLSFPDILLLTTERWCSRCSRHLFFGALHDLIGVWSIRCTVLTDSQNNTAEWLGSERTYGEWILPVCLYVSAMAVIAVPAKIRAASVTASCFFMSLTTCTLFSCEFQMITQLFVTESFQNNVFQAGPNPLLHAL